MNDETNIPRIEQGQIEQAQHERLCAYVFGELQGAERAEFEAELLRSPALQAERARLNATIGLVKRAVPDEGLSHEVRRDIVASARRSRFRILRGRPLALVAAAVVVLVGGALAVRLATSESSPFTYSLSGDVKVAKEGTSGLAKRERALALEVKQEERKDQEKNALESLRGLGYIGGDDGAPAATASEEPRVPPAEMKDLRELGYGERKARTDLAVAAESAVIDRNSLPATSAPAVPAAPPPQDALFARPSAAPEEVLSAFEKSPTAGTGIQATAVGPAGAAGPAATGGSGVFVSRRAGTAARSTKPLTAGRASKGTYRGPGDSVPSGSTAQATGSDGFFLGSGEREKSVALREPLVTDGTNKEREQLDALGYGGEADEVESGAVELETARKPVQTREQVLAQVEELLKAPRIADGESPSMMFSRYWGESPLVLARENKLSTFAVDVDTASYALSRSYLNAGELPPRASVRTEEFVNYFKADQPPPTDGKPFAIGLELAPSLFASDPRTEMLRVTVRGKDVADFERQPLALTFVIDNSGSMEQGGRLDLVKRSLALLLRQLASGDTVAVVKFSNDASIVTPPLAATQRGELESRIQGLAIEGGTNVEAGLRKGYELALENLRPNAINRVILCSDGVGNIGETDANALVALVKGARAKGIYLNTVGVGMGNHNDTFLEQFADQGDGVCNYVDSDAEAKRVFVDGLASAVQPIARDVKIQVEFDPNEVESWRLLGYENRSLRTQDFRDDEIDAGEVNAGHQVTALYELVRTGGRGGSAATVRLRYKPPFAIDAGHAGERAQADAEKALEIERSLGVADVRPGFPGASNGYKRAVLVAQFAEVLRQSAHARGDSLATLVREAQQLEKNLGDPDVTEFVALLGKSNPMLDAREKSAPKVQPLLDELAELHFQLGQAERNRQLQTAASDTQGELEERLGALGEGAEKRDEVLRREEELRARIANLEAAVREQVLVSRGFDVDSATQGLHDLGYGRDKR